MLLFGLFYLQLHFGRTYVQYDLVEVVGLPTSTVMEASIKPQKIWFRYYFVKSIRYGIRNTNTILSIRLNILRHEILKDT